MSTNEQVDPLVGRHGDEQETWEIWRVGLNGEPGEKVFESSDPQTIVDKAHDLEQKAVDELPLPGIAAMSYHIVGDPVALGVFHLKDEYGNVVHGPKELRTPRTKQPPRKK